MYDTIEWIAAQAWSNGKVGMTGESYYEALQWFAAQQQPPHLAAIAPYDAFCDTYRDVSYHGGVPCAGFPTWWSYNTRALTLLDQPGPHPEQLYAAIDQADTDFLGKLSDQHPRSLLTLPFLPMPSECVTRGFLRASHAVTKDATRSTEHRPYYAHDHTQLLEPGRIYNFEIEIWPTSWVFKKGHRIRLELANADSPVFDAPFSHHYGTKIGIDTIYHDAQRPSHLDLPVIPRARSGRG